MTRQGSNNVATLSRCGFGCGILTAFRASSELQSQILRCSSVVRVSRLSCSAPLGICVEPRAKQEERSVLLRLLCPFLGVFLSVFFTLSLAIISHLGYCCHAQEGDWPRAGGKSPFSIMRTSRNDLGQQRIYIAFIKIHWY